MEIKLNTEPLTQLYNEIDPMTKEDALIHIRTVIEATLTFRNRYEQLMLSVPHDSPDFEAYKKAWEIDLSNFLKLVKAYGEVSSEE